MRPTSLSLADEIHSQAVAAASNYKNSEAHLVGVLQKVETHAVHLRRGYPSVFRYVVEELGLSESAAYGMITVARKAREVPELRAEIERGAMTLSNARRVATY